MESKQIPTPDSDARQTPPSFDEMVEMIKKLFTDYLEDHVKSKPSEITKSWERYRALNHLWQDGQQPVPRWVKSSERLPGWNIPVKWRLGHGPETSRKIALSEMTDNSNEILKWQWYDESGTDEDEGTMYDATWGYPM